MLQNRFDLITPVVIRITAELYSRTAGETSDFSSISFPYLQFNYGHNI